MTLKGGATPSCAACKYRRRKCIATCPLAPYFPANKPKIFQNVHRLFGVSNVTKTLESLETKDQKDDAMKSIIYEAEMRAQLPVYGCPFIISQLSFQLQVACEELRRIYSQIAACKEQQSNQRMDHNSCHWPSSQQESGSMCTPCINSQDVEGMESVPFQFFLNEDYGISAESLENLAMLVVGLDLRPDAISIHNFFSTHPQKEQKIFIRDYGGLRYSTTTDESLQKEPEIFFQNYDGLRYSKTADHRQSCIEYKEACESSDFQNATASCGLTTVNHNEELGFEFWNQIFNVMSTKFFVFFPAKSLFFPQPILVFFSSQFYFFPSGNSFFTASKILHSKEPID
ncbi:uncharacterized protein [Primulina huaijiensis]|uniref:uncharacterized protein n=1 Tax=Primulina huaijiensis TaxID=1492673 RepID=UPI003CC77411